MPSSTRRSSHAQSTRCLDDDSSDDEYRRRDIKSSRPPRGYDRKDSPSTHTRKSSLVRREQEHDDHHDSQWDTDYDPKDKYYLSADDDPFDLYDSDSKGHKSSTRDKPSTRDRRDSPVRDREDSPRHHHSSRGDHPHPHTESRHHHHSRNDRDDSPERRHEPTSHSKPSSHASRPRPRPLRAPSSYVARPRPARAASSYLGSVRPRITRAASSHLNVHSKHHPRSRPRAASRQLSAQGNRKQKSKSVRNGPTPLQEFPWRDAAQVAMQAGTVAAIKVGMGPEPWAKKGVKIASAAMGAAVVDHIVKPKTKVGIKYSATRHLAELAIGNLVAGPMVSSMTGGGKSSGGGGGGRRR